MAVTAPSRVSRTARIAASDPNRVIIFDTTMRDGEQAPGFSMSAASKLKMAGVLRDLGVDVIEAGFAAASPGEAAANPASITSTPRSRSTPAIFSLAAADMEKPGACSPSRMGVSKMMTRFGSDAAICAVLDTRVGAVTAITRPPTG